VGGLFLKKPNCEGRVVCLTGDSVYRQRRVDEKSRNTLHRRENLKSKALFHNCSRYNLEVVEKLQVAKWIKIYRKIIIKKYGLSPRNGVLEKLMSL
jgi:hypothetical protein